jgi:hypothetical protein
MDDFVDAVLKGNEKGGSTMQLNQQQKQQLYDSPFA